ncbi:chaoptin isoform X2 [Pieris napi]|uniref:chaoptin isoform X2 n=1 Tax=Pieris napi TaxID=78633 RepID=UPI001FBA54B4|nr:chaoptin isoform X2 [Pieris napi]
MGLMSIIKLGYTMLIVAFLLMIWASLSGALELHVDTGHPPCLFQALCTCSKPAGDLGIVTCNYVPILKVPSAVNNSKVFTLQLTGNRIKDLEPQFFQATGLYRLAINENPLESIHEEAFYGLDNTLWELELKQDRLAAVPSRALRYLQKLRLLDLSGNEITDISGDNWRGLENTLHTLILSDNSISTIPLDAFSGLPMLDTLDLRGNHLSVIDSGVFRDGMHRLNKLLLGNNQLTLIPYEELSPLRQLRYLDLSKNLIKQVPPAHELNGITLSLDTLRLDNNIIRILLPGSFKYFNVLNTTSLDGNPIYTIREDAFRNAKIRSLSLRDCGVTELSPASFAGLENTLQNLDLSENNLTMISKFMLNKLDSLRFLNLRENKVDTNLLSTGNPSDFSVTSVNNFQYKLFYLDISGSSPIEMSLQDIRRMRSLRYLAVSKLIRRSISSEDFIEYGLELEDLKIFGSTITKIEASAFQHVRTIKTLDLSENEIDFIDPFAFAELHSLTTLKIANGLADSVKILPFEPLKALNELQHLDLSNNKLKNVPDTSFHFLYNVRTLNLQDNLIEQFSKGTLQGDIHRQLQGIYLSFNKMTKIVQHTFVDLRELQEIQIEDNLIDTIERRAFMSVDNLKVIRLQGNRLRDISEEAFQNLPALKELDISFNRLEMFKFSIFDQVGSATALKVNASFNQIVSLTDSNARFGFGSSNFYPPPKPQSLISVDDQENTDKGKLPHGQAVTASPYRLFLSVNIRVLDFSHNNISYIAPYYFRHADLTLSELHLSHNQIKNITREVFGSMLMLQYLDLSHNQIFHMEYDCFKKVKNLQMDICGLGLGLIINGYLRILNLSHNHLTELPVEVFHDMQMLTSVDLSHNRIRNLADNLILSANLERLDLSNNDLSRMPTNALSPGAASNLVELDLSSNTVPAVAIPDLVQRFRNSEAGEFWPEENDYNDDYMYHTARRDQSRVFHHKKQYPQNIFYKSLAWLDLSNNHLVRIESGAFGALPKLRWLDLSNNLPFNGDRSGNIFKGLERKLSYLGLKNVSLQAIPSLPLPKLKTLDLSYNNLHSIPTDTTANLTRLRALDLSYNDLTKVPVATHSLSDLRWLSLSGNPITALMNTSLYGLSPRLEYLDVTRLRLSILEYGVFSKMYGLRTLKISVNGNVRDFSIPKMTSQNAALENLFLSVENSQIDLGNEMKGELPCKLDNITLTGRELKFISQNLLNGACSREMRLTIFNTSIEDISSEVFWRHGRIKNLSLDLRNNQLKRLPNPARKEWPGVPNDLFLDDILVASNPLVCDCGIGWIQAWDRKRRQYLCDNPSSCDALDDLRLATCPSYQNRTLSDVISKELDCSWSKGYSIVSNIMTVLGVVVAFFVI